MEIWRDIEGYVGFYQISNMGNIKSLERKRIGKFGGKFKEFILKQSTRGGYKNIVLHKDRIKTSPIGVHRLVAQAFIHNYENKCDVNHKNGIRDDNRVENLEWCSRSENILHSYRVLGNVPWNKGKWLHDNKYLTFPTND